MAIRGRNSFLFFKGHSGNVLGSKVEARNPCQVLKDLGLFITLESEMNPNTWHFKTALAYGGVSFLEHKGLGNCKLVRTSLTK